MSEMSTENPRISVGSTISQNISEEKSKRFESFDISKEVSHTPEKKKKKVSLKMDFVQIINVECWKKYNIDCSENLTFWDQQKERNSQKENVKCSCVLF